MRENAEEGELREGRRTAEGPAGWMWVWSWGPAWPSPGLLMAQAPPVASGGAWLHLQKHARQTSVGEMGTEPLPMGWLEEPPANEGGGRGRGLAQPGSV